ncbi:metalloregulator ArsR/SmtB family transcription factor [Teredinibacter sp. KSP-S5-2]|uniref:ArsR/SmtB family transcription factor n=1 Tax=Teredinibacter sp. KSP-S5-2 TaxID=3034506 RepID=UPI0029342641|nr:metalloregulator ArsR/SmtB family transcription factor [Teredinibacter sp. KSP-S5-2]WNO08490.1 metalloregulator ArsR/SmtB family transcription factor [Teredinibacter sp. KSP-S5-2]
MSTCEEFDVLQLRAHANNASRLLKALANENRLLILCILSQGELSVSQLNEQLDLSQSALSQHLAVLRKDGLVNTRRDSQTIYYSIVEGPAARVIETLHGIYCSVSTELVDGGEVQA